VSAKTMLTRIRIRSLSVGFCVSGVFTSFSRVAVVARERRKYRTALQG
jgi:hypothetical protein